MELPPVDPVIAMGVVLSTAVTDAVNVFFNSAVSARRRFAAASPLSAHASDNCSNWARTAAAASSLSATASPALSSGVPLSSACPV